MTESISIKNSSLPQQKKKSSTLKKEVPKQQIEVQLKRPCLISRGERNLHQFFSVKRRKLLNAPEKKPTYVPFQEVFLKETSPKYVPNVIPVNPYVGVFSSAPVVTSVSSTVEVRPKVKTEKITPISDGGASLKDYIEAKDIEIFPQDIRNAIACSQTTPHSLSTSYLNLFHGHPIADLRYAVISRKTYAEILAKREIEPENHIVPSGCRGLLQLHFPSRSLLDEILSHLVYDFNQFNLPESSPDYEEALIQLQEFDNCPLGPRSGLTRLERFERGQNAGKYIPQCLKKLLLSLQGQCDPKIKFSSFSKI
ncbi:hypothetical protein DSO57_1027260 [Entomophthora muscae]|uniref:Uncharacterized protein n=1 Tax=Entomophthora muscae TaxID=34485 RepID=A0ACC2T223_9FUNG|nr:hypothetical protein DSO57_1027260 [Entomophthora muscae]